MEVDRTVYMIGVDMSTGISRVSAGLVDRFGTDRVIDTPISESAIIGSPVGAAMAGMRPVAELMFIDFLGMCFDQLLNQAAKLRFMTGGRVEIPLVVRTQYGAGRSAGAQHSQSLEAILASVVGLQVVIPSNPADAYGPMRTVIDEPNPVVFIEHGTSTETQDLRFEPTIGWPSAPQALPGKEATSRWSPLAARFTNAYTPRSRTSPSPIPMPLRCASAPVRVPHRIHLRSRPRGCRTSKRSSTD